MWYNGYTGLRLHFDVRKSQKLRHNPNRGIGFEEAEEIFQHDYYLMRRSQVPEQFCATGWARGQLYSVIFEVRHYAGGEYYHLVTLWKATTQETKLYEENS